MNSLVITAVILGITAYFGSILGSLVVANRIQPEHPTISKLAPVIGCVCAIAAIAIVVGAVDR